MIMVTRVLAMLALASVTASEYERIVKGCVNSNNLVKYTGKSVSQCAELCDGNPACKAFEYGRSYGGGSNNYNPRDCQLNSSSNYNNCDGGFYNLDLYIRPEYTKYTKGCVNGHNIKLYRDVDQRECENLCNDYGSGCKGFEYGVNYGGNYYDARDCQLNSSSGRSGCDGAYYNLDFYAKKSSTGRRAVTEDVVWSMGSRSSLIGLGAILVEKKVNSLREHKYAEGGPPWGYHGRHGPLQVVQDHIL